MDETPMVLAMGPSLIMGAASFSTGIIAAVHVNTNGGSLMTALPSMIMSVSMLCGMIVFPFMMKSRDRRKKREKEEMRRETYLLYLKSVRGEMANICAVQREILHESFPLVTVWMRKREFF